MATSVRYWFESQSSQCQFKSFATHKWNVVLESKETSKCKPGIFFKILAFIKFHLHVVPKKIQLLQNYLHLSLFSWCYFEKMKTMCLGVKPAELLKVADNREVFWVLWLLSPWPSPEGIADVKMSAVAWLRQFR